MGWVLLGLFVGMVAGVLVGIPALIWLEERDD